MITRQLPTEAVQQEMKDYTWKIQASPIVNEFHQTTAISLFILQILKRSSLEPIQDLYKTEISPELLISTLVFSFATGGKQAQNA